MKLSDELKDATKFRDVERVLGLIGKHQREILAAVEAAEEGRVLPRLPEGYHWCIIEYDYLGSYLIGCRNPDIKFSGKTGYGPTPAAAAQAAIEKIGEINAVP